LLTLFRSFKFAAASEVGLKNTQNPGMTLKDWFAGPIIAAMLGSDPANSSQRDKNGQLCKNGVVQTGQHGHHCLPGG